MTSRTSASWAARSGLRRQAVRTVPPTTDHISTSPPMAWHGRVLFSNVTYGGFIAGRPRFGLTVTSTPPDGSAASGSGQPWNSPLFGSGVGHGRTVSGASLSCPGRRHQRLARSSTSSSWTRSWPFVPGATGIGTRLVQVGLEEVRRAGCEWLYADLDEQLESFYFGACGFVPTPAGLIEL
jgi:hypothetical protein